MLYLVDSGLRATTPQRLKFFGCEIREQTNSLSRQPADRLCLHFLPSGLQSSAFWNARVNKLSNRSEDSDLDRSRIQWNSKPTDAVYKVRLTHKFGRGKQFSAHVARVGEGYFLARENNSILRNVEKCEWAKEMRSYGMSGRVEWVRNGVLNGKGCCGLGRLRNLKIARGLVWGLVMYIFNEELIYLDNI